MDTPDAQSQDPKGQIADADKPLHFTEQDTEAQRGEATCPRSPSPLVCEMR